jgi:putative membrane protein
MLEKKKFSAFFVFFLTGALGLSVLNLNIKEPLLPLLTGLFGSSMLIMSIKNKTIIPKQEISKPKINKKFLSPILGALIASPLPGMLPGLGSGQAAILGNTISRTDREGFLVLLGATNTIVMGFSFIALYLIARTRTGAAVAINNLLGNFPWQILVLILGVVLFTGIISFFLTSALAKFFSKKITDINYTKLSLITLGILIVVVSVFSGFWGLLVLIFSTLTGIYCISLGVKRTNMMGCLLLPTIVFYLAL